MLDQSEMKVDMHTLAPGKAVLAQKRLPTVVRRIANRSRIAGIWLLAMFATAAAAEPVAGRATSWVCWYANGTSVACRLAAPDENMLVATDTQLQVPEGGALLPAGVRSLPEIVRTILQQPERLVGRTISIPLFTQARDLDFVRELAEAVMCGTRQRCRVLFFDSSPEIALALDAIEDPALN